MLGGGGGVLLVFFYFMYNIPCSGVYKRGLHVISISLILIYMETCDFGCFICVCLCVYSFNLSQFCANYVAGESKGKTTAGGDGECPERERTTTDGNA